MAKTRILIFVLLAGVTGFACQDGAYAASCEALVGKWAWFIGGEVTVNADGTFTQQSGNAGTWECNDAARGRFTFRWRDGGFVNSLVLSPDGQGLSSTDQSQWYVTAQRTTPAPTPPLVRKEDCCQEAYGCETKRIEAAFDAQMVQCHHSGNAACVKEAVSTKAEQLKAANANLRLCNRAASGAALPPVPSAGGVASSSTGNEEFHSTERPGFFSQACQACDVIASGQDTVPPEAEPPTFKPPLEGGVEKKVVPEPRPIEERWEEWAKDYNDKVKSLLDDFGFLVPDDGNDYLLTAMVRVFPNGTIQVGPPSGTYFYRTKPGQTEKAAKLEAQRVVAEHKPMFRQSLVNSLRPLPFPEGSRLAWWEYPVTYRRSEVDTRFEPAPTPTEPPPQSTQRKSR